jgi:hypothetical protein
MRRGPRRYAVRPNGDGLPLRSARFRTRRIRSVFAGTSAAQTGLSCSASLLQRVLLPLPRRDSAVRMNNPPFARTLPEDTACGQRPRRCGGARQRLGRSRRRGSSGRRPHPPLPAVPRRFPRVFRTAGHTASGSWGGDCALAGGDRGGRRPRFRSTSSAVRRLLMTATTRRLPPQGHCQTSASKVLRCKEAQSSRGRLGLSVSRTQPAPLPGKGASATPSCSRALTTRARSFAFGANTP